jgi:hypothetical protein
MALRTSPRRSYSRSATTTCSIVSMVRYRPIGASISLSLANLDATTTLNPITATTKALTDAIDATAKELRREAGDRTLPELVIPDDGEIPFHLRFLGPQQDMPFYLVRSGLEAFTSSKAERSRTSPATNYVPALASPPSTYPELIPFHLNDGIDSETHGRLLDQCQTLRYPDISSGIRDTHIPSDENDPQTRAWVSGVALAPWSAFPSPEKDSSLHCMDFDGDGNLIPHRNIALPSVEAWSSHQSPAARRATTYQGKKSPQALCLTIQLSRKSFLQWPRPEMAKGNKKLQDIKIDIFYNGELCDSTVVPQRMRLDSNVAELTQQFSGRRIDRVIERPWTFIPSEKNANGVLREVNNALKVSCEERWNEISLRLRAEAENAEGRNHLGELGVLGTYLSSLASLPMPKELQDLSVVGGTRIGIIDVVLTCGLGKKDEAGAGYLLHPTPIRIVPPMRFKAVQKKPEIPTTGDSQVTLDIPRKVPRPKTYSDAEIIASTSTPYLGPRTTRMVAPLLGNPMAKNKGPSRPSGSNRSSSAPRYIAAYPDKSVMDPSKVIDLTTPRRDNLIDKIQRAGYLPIVMEPSAVSDALCKALEPTFSFETSTTRSSASEQPMSKRHRRNNPSTLQANIDFEKPRPSSRQRRPPTTRRARTSEGRFATKPPTPQARFPSGRPKVIPQKTYKGVEAESEKESQDQSDILAEPCTPKLTVSEQMQAIEREAAAQQLNGRTAPHFGVSSYATRRSTPLKVSAPNVVPSMPLVPIVESPPVIIDLTDTKTSPSTSSHAPPVTPAQDVAPKKSLVVTLHYENRLKFSTFTASNSKVVVNAAGSLTESPLTPVELMTPVSSLDNSLSLNKKRPHAEAFDSSSDTDGGSRSAYGTPTRRRTAKPKTKDEKATQTPKPKTSRSTSGANTPAIPTTPAPEPKKRVRNPRVGPPNWDSFWEAGTLHDDCVIGYGRGLMRQVGAKRNGWFQESSILMGVRFVVDGGGLGKSEGNSSGSGDSGVGPSGQCGEGSIEIGMSVG